MKKQKNNNPKDENRFLRLLKEYIPPIHKTAIPLVSILGIILFISFFLTPWISYPTFIIFSFTFFFFRNPKRFPPLKSGVFVAPADGVITEIKKVNGPKELNLENQEFIRISIFLSIFNVHSQRSPHSAIVSDIKYFQGKFLSADRDESIESNERNHIVFKTKENEIFVVTQIAGTIARRILNFTKINQHFNIGDTIGLIKFGSRVNLLLPVNYNIMIEENQHTIAGETILATEK